jgi:protein-L-isoaspartate(D-aspartate) O-methyltransferase
MVREQIEARGIRDRAVLQALRKVPRHEFVPFEHRAAAYDDHPLPLGSGQTLSQPYIVALMTELLELKAGQRLLEIGTGSGYQTAVLAELGAEVYSIEIVPMLVERARATLDRLEYTTVQLRRGDGSLGWPDASPFDGIIVTAAPPQVPQPLIDQLRQGGHLIVPEGVREQTLVDYTQGPDGRLQRDEVLPVRFVPMTGRAGQ